MLRRLINEFLLSFRAWYAIASQVKKTPAESKKLFLKVIGRQSNTYNNIAWQIHFNDEQLKEITYDKSDILSCIKILIHLTNCK